jgi:zinc transport system substrate-binding protein
MKILTTILLLLSLLSPQPAMAGSNPLRIIAMNFPAFDFSRVIAGNRGQVELLLPPGAEAHSYEPSPRDMVALQQADLLVYNGGIGDYWVEETLASLGDEAPEALRMMDAVPTVEEEITAGMEDVLHEQEGPDLDEHVWTAPANAKLIAGAIAGRLALLDPEGQAGYQERFAAYSAELDELDLAFREMIQASKRKTIVLGDRFPMRYFAMEYGLAYYAAFPGCSAQTEPSPKTLAFLIGKMAEEKIPVVFYIEFSNQRAARIIAEETGAKALLLHSAHNVNQKEMDEGVSYLSIMRNNLIALREALN